MIPLNRWYGLVFNFATTPSAVSGAAGGEGSGGTGAGSGGGAPVSTGGAPAAPAQPSINWETAPAQFREAFSAQKRAFEELQGKHGAYEKLGKVEDISRVQSQHTAAVSAAKSIADGLQIPETELRDAINQYGIAAVLHQLRQEQWESEQAQQGNQDVLRDQDLNERINSAAQHVLGPIQQRENQRMTHEGNQLVERTISEIATNQLKAQGVDWQGLPNEYKNFFLTGVTEVLKYDQEGLNAIKFQGQTAPIQRAVATFTAMADAYYLARRSSEGNMRGGQQRQQAPAAKPNGFKQPSIDEMLTDPDIIRTSQGKAAYSS